MVHGRGPFGEVGAQPRTSDAQEGHEAGVHVVGRDFLRCRLAVRAVCASHLTRARSAKLSGAMGERTLEAAYHEAGHLVVIEYLFSANEHFWIDFATILSSADSGGGIGWQFSDSETEEDRCRLCTVLMAGTFYERSLSKTTPEDRLQIHFSGDFEKITEFGLIDLIDDAVMVLQDTLEAVGPIVMLVAKELSQRKTFYAGESALVLQKYRALMDRSPDFSAIDQELQDYRKTRAYAMNPPDTWQQRGPWRESLDAWRARERSHAPTH